MQTIKEIAQYVLYIYDRYCYYPMDELKLHKLLYFCQRESLLILNEPLFIEPMQGWVHGPVSPYIRANYATLGKKKIEMEEAKIQMIHHVIYKYGNISSWKLRNLTHQEYAWKRSRSFHLPQEIGKEVIQLDDIRQEVSNERAYDAIWDMYFDEFETKEEEFYE